MIELELSIVLLMSLFSTALYLPRKELVWGIIAFGCWQVTAFLWVLISPMSSTYSIAFLFQAIAIIILITIIIQLLLKLKMKGYEPSELD